MVGKRPDASAAAAAVRRPRPCANCTASQSRGSSSGPFTMSPLAATTVVSSMVMVSNLPLRFQRRRSSSRRRLTRPASAPFGVRASAPIRPVIRGPRRRSQHYGARFPAAFRLPAFASRVVLRPPRDSAFLTVGLPNEHTWPGPQRGCHVPHETDTTGLGALCTPGTVVRSRLAKSLRTAPAASQRPAPISH